MKLIAFICRGNTCRSPLAEALARRSRETGAAAFVAVSAGVAVDRPGAPADPRARAVANLHSLNLDAHRATALSEKLVSRADLLIALDTQIRTDIITAWQCDPERVHLMMSFAPEHGVSDVADPFYGTDADYERAFELIAAGVTGIMRSAKLK